MPLFRFPWLFSVPAVFLAAGPMQAHPVARDNHDRIVVVHLSWDAGAGQVIVWVDYRLEVDPFTVVNKDMKRYWQEADSGRFKGKDLAFYGEFARIYEPILADHLVGEANGKALKFTGVGGRPTLRDEKGAFFGRHRRQTLKDEKDENLGHLRCDFVFRTSFTPRPDQENLVHLEEQAYLDQKGKIDLSLGSVGPIRITAKTEPGTALKNRPLIEMEPGDEKKLRNLTVRFYLSKEAPSSNQSEPGPPAENSEKLDHDSLLHLFLNSEYGFWMLMLLAAGIGAAHALTPGHGKTLVAAYLVGQRGTVWHAILLGLVTTVTHTGVVLLLALGLLFLPDDLSAGARQSIQTGLGLAMGVVIAGLGCWLLLRRLSGRADHFHLGGAHHHHHGDGNYHHHHEHGHDHHHHDHSPAALAAGSRLNMWGLVVLGMTGGIIPCWDAIAMLVLAVGMNLFWLALPMLLAFSAGLAGVLVVIGVLVVQMRNFAGSKWGEGRLVRALPIASAVFVTAIGLWLCYNSVRFLEP